MGRPGMMLDHAYLPAAGDLPAPDAASAAMVRARAGQVLRPMGALDRLDEIAVWLAGWQGTATPRVVSPAVVLFAGDHGVAVAGVSAYPAEVTGVMKAALEGGVATASVMCAELGAELSVVDVGVGRPTGDIRVEPALSPERFDECWRAGRDAVSRLQGVDLLVLGEMGIANTTPAAAVSAALFSEPSDGWAGRGTGIGDEMLAVKMASIEMAVTRAGASGSPLEIMRQLGGSELVAIAGAVVEARMRSLPVVLDGFVVTAACAVLEVARPGLLDHTLAGHCSAEPGHRRLLEKLGKTPVLDLGLRLGEASGALAAVPLIALAARCVTDVATFEEWGLAR